LSAHPGSIPGFAAADSIGLLAWRCCTAQPSRPGNRSSGLRGISPPYSRAAATDFHRLPGTESAVIVVKHPRRAELPHGGELRLKVARVTSQVAESHAADCHSERSEESLLLWTFHRREIFRFAQNDNVLSFSPNCSGIRALTEKNLKPLRGRFSRSPGTQTDSRSALRPQVNIQRGFKNFFQ
jgi:hypothetical protein